MTPEHMWTGLRMAAPTRPCWLRPACVDAGGTRGHQGYKSGRSRQSTSPAHAGRDVGCQEQSTYRTGPFTGTGFTRPVGHGRTPLPALLPQGERGVARPWVGCPWQPICPWLRSTVGRARRPCLVMASVVGAQLRTDEKRRG